MNEYIQDELIENTYLFCAKRISDSEEAKDLAQDILYEALRGIATGKTFVSFYSWYWRMARNKYADYVAHKQNPALPLETAGGMAAQTPEPLERLIDAEELSLLNYSLSRLTFMYREMMIRFYLKEQSIVQIARELDIPEGTVKRRLFDAKNTLKERFEIMNNVGISSYAPAKVTYFWGGNSGNNGNSVNAQTVMKQKIAQQACVFCRREAKTVNEIADELGVAPVYLEPVLEQMIDTDLMTSPVKGKYITNFCVFPEQVYQDACALSCIQFRKNGFNEKTAEILMGLKEKVMALDFYGKGFAYEYLMWLLYVEAGYSYAESGKAHYCGAYGDKYPESAERRYNITMFFAKPEETVDFSGWDEVKAIGWSNLHQSFVTTEYGKVTFVNNYDADPFPADYDIIGSDSMGSRDNWVNGNNISLLVDLSENPKKELNPYEEEQAASFLKCGLVKKTAEGLVVQIPIFTKEVYATICDYIKEALKDLVCEYAEIIGNTVEKLLLPYVRIDLMSTFIHWDMKMFFQTVCNLLYYGMYESETLQIPEEYERSGAGLYIVRG